MSSFSEGMGVLRQEDHQTSFEGIELYAYVSPRSHPNVGLVSVDMFGARLGGGRYLSADLSGSGPAKVKSRYPLLRPNNRRSFSVRYSTRNARQSTIPRWLGAEGDVRGVLVGGAGKPRASWGC
jgi:hypothetical protein